ncbi:hypothetical protein NIES267_74670 (plasmid) [Calothrix parasitica NIES-267]|uniref:Uncharacterized protein n=1 Tax=Calothrix parasitica NIES-267 TaxID=1973488 RepID=A0A1Z4M373_9CYAN|nr:hypothetical protein NIES267_74670 [Calothrix parasitica NIES-267]
MSENIHNLQQLANFYKNASLVNQRIGYSKRQEAEKFAILAIQNPEHRDECLIQEQEYLRRATARETIAERQLEYARICENPVNEYQNIINNLIDLLNRIRICQETQCSNNACQEILNLIETYCLKDSHMYEDYLQCCGHIN